MNRTRITMLVVVALGMTMNSALASADDEVGFRGWGPRLGLSFDPDQFYFGAHADFGNFAEHIRFQPNLELGFSDNVRLFTLNAEAAYRFREQWDVWSPYLGGGVGANRRSFDNGNNTHSDTELGVNILGGIEKGISGGDRFFIETKLSLNDVPDVKIGVGWTFYH